LSQSVAFVGPASNSGVSHCDCLAHRFGNATDHAGCERRYPSELTDAQRAVVRDALPLPRRREGREGRPESYCHRTMVDAVLYLVDNGQCRCLSWLEDYDPVDLGGLCADAVAGARVAAPEHELAYYGQPGGSRWSRARCCSGPWQRSSPPTATGPGRRARAARMNAVRSVLTE
jgi:hypothetical protein